MRQLSLHHELDSSLFSNQASHHVRSLVELGSALHLEEALLYGLTQRMALWQMQFSYLE